MIPTAEIAPISAISRAAKIFVVLPIEAIKRPRKTTFGLPMLPNIPTMTVQHRRQIRESGKRLSLPQQIEIRPFHPLRSVDSQLSHELVGLANAGVDRFVFP